MTLPAKLPMSLAGSKLFPKNASNIANNVWFDQQQCKIEVRSWTALSSWPEDRKGSNFALRLAPSSLRIATCQPSAEIVLATIAITPNKSQDIAILQD